MATGDKLVPRSDLRLDNDLIDGLCDLRIVLVGTAGTGKSATGNTLIGSEKKVFKSSGSRTSVTTECSVAEMERFGNKLVVVDTPGVFDTTMTEDELKIQLMECTYLACPGVHAFLFLMKIGQKDIANEDTKAFHMIKNLFGEEFLSHAIVVFTGKEALDEDGVEIEEYISNLPDGCKMFIKSFNGGVVAISNISEDAAKKESARHIIGKVKDLVEQNGGRRKYYKNVLFDEKNNKINERMDRILNANKKVHAQIKQINKQLECLRMCIEDGNPTEEQDALLHKFGKQFEYLQKALVDRKSARITANNEIEYEMKMKKIKMIIGGAFATAGTAAVAATISNPTAVIAGVSMVTSKFMTR